MNHKKIILLFGPTASGKTRLAIDIAKKYNGEIINADSMQIYKEVKILSARPKDSIIKHHLYGIVSIKNNFSVALWHKLAAKKIKDVIKKKKIPIIVGGTGLYFKILIEGLTEIPEIPKNNINLNIFNKKNVIDNYIRKYPKIFKDIDLNDKQRLLRAISVYEHTGTFLSEWYKKKNKKKYFKSDQFVKIYLNPPKENIEDEIKKRFNKMLEEGAIKEVKNFKKMKIDPLLSSNFIIGVREISDFLSNVINVDQLREKVIIRSRQYAKRQFTWQRGQMKDWKGFVYTNYPDLLKKTLSYLSKT